LCEYGYTEAEPTASARRIALHCIIAANEKNPARDGKKKAGEIDGKPWI
jgi:hypothetical protein